MRKSNVSPATPTPACDSASASIRAPLNREVAGAAAEIRHEHSLLSPNRARVPIGGAERLIGEIDFCDARAPTGACEALHRQAFVWPLSRENHGTAAHDREIAETDGKDVLQKDADQLLEQKAPAEQIRVLHTARNPG